MNLAQENRLRFIDLMLRQYGHLNRKTLELMFGISTPQASLDIGAYTIKAPANLEYNKSLRHYQRGAGFVPLYPAG